MKSLQNQYNLIKEGKGNKETFLKEAKTLFPNVVTNVLTYDQAIHNLTERGIISEGFIGVSSQRAIEPNWFKVFNENVDVKATLKQTDKSVEEKETAGYDYKEKKNNNNISTAEILTGYYAEMKNPKNADKTETEIKAVVFKNLEKDPLHYVKGGQFGLEGVGYTEEAPGLGKPKEAKGKYKSSGYGDLRENKEKRELSLKQIDKKDKKGLALYKNTEDANDLYYYDGKVLYNVKDDGSKGPSVRMSLFNITGLKELKEGINDLTAFHKGSHSTGRPDFNKMTADQIEAYLEKDKDKPGGLFGRSLSIVQYILKKKREEEKLKENNSPFNDGGEPMMTRQQYKDYSQPSEPDDDYDGPDNGNHMYKGEVENALKNAGIKFKQQPVYYDNSTPNDGEIKKINLLIPDGDIFINFESESEIGISQYSSEEEKHFDLEDRPYPLNDMILYIKKLQKTKMEGKAGMYTEGKEDDVKKKLMPNKQKGIADSMEVKSTLEKVANQIWTERDVNKAKEIFKKHIEESGMNDASKKQMLYTLTTITTKPKLDYYLANALLKYEKLSVKEGMVSELNLSIPRRLKDLIQDATEDSKNGYVQHIEYAGPGIYRISDWFDSDNTIYSVEDGRVLLDKTNEIDIEGNWEGAMDEAKHGKTLAEAKKRAIEKHLQEIEKLGEIAAIDHKIQKIQEKIEELKNKITMTEGGDFAEMVDRTAVREIKKDIALLEKRKKMAETQKARLGKKVSGQGKPQTHAGGGHETGMMEGTREEEEGEKAKSMARNAMKTAIGLGGKSKSWEDTVKDVLATRNVKK